MKKMSTLFTIVYPAKTLLREIREENYWVHDLGVLATRKFDCSACAIFSGVLYKRWDNKKGKVAPKGAIECQNADKITGHPCLWHRCYSNLPSIFYRD